MIYLGLDDTDQLDTPGTNQLARHLLGLLPPLGEGTLISRHQLLVDPRVPCTRKNGCACLHLPLAAPSDVEAWLAPLRAAIRRWCPPGSDPGLCLATRVPAEITAWGRRCQRELVTQDEARRVAAAAGLHLEGLGGTEDGVIGALAAVGLGAEANDGHVLHRGPADDPRFQVTGEWDVAELLGRGVDEVRRHDTGQRLDSGRVLLEKRVRPWLRGGRLVLMVRPLGDGRYTDVRTDRDRSASGS